VPIDLAATTVSGITLEAYANIRRHLGMRADPHPPIAHLHQGIYAPAEDLLNHYEVDFRDEYGILWKRGLYDYAPVSAPLQQATIGDLVRACTGPAISLWSPTSSIEVLSSWPSSCAATSSS